MSLGYDRNVYMLAFDDRASFQKGLFGVEGTPSLAEAYTTAGAGVTVAANKLPIGVGLGWHQYVGLDGEVIAMQTFGTSAPLKDVVKKFGFTPEHVVAAAKAQL